MFEAIIFDLDGTLVDSREDLARSVQAAFVELKVPKPEREAVIASVGHGARHLIEVLLPERGADPDLVDAMLATFQAHYLEHLLDQTRAFAGLPEVLEQLEAIAPLAVLTNKPGEMARKIIEGLGLGHFFRLVVGPDDVDALKPDPKGLLEVLARLGARPEASLYVGDMPVDVEVARAAGTLAVAVRWGLSPEDEIRAAGADHLIDRPEALLTLVG